MLYFLGVKAFLLHGRNSINTYRLNEHPDRVMLRFSCAMLCQQDLVNKLGFFSGQAFFQNGWYFFFLLLSFCGAWIPTLLQWFWHIVPLDINFSFNLYDKLSDRSHFKEEGCRLAQTLNDISICCDKKGMVVRLPLWC